VALQVKMNARDAVHTTGPRVPISVAIAISSARQVCVTKNSIAARIYLNFIIRFKLFRAASSKLQSFGD